MSKKTTIKERITHIKRKLGLDKQENEKIQKKTWIGKARERKNTRD